MKLNFLEKITILLFITSLQFSYSQKKEENIGSEEVNVIKAYTPTVSDAFKVIEHPPVQEEEDTTKKEAIEYSIFPFPVASTFTPAKGKAEGVEKKKRAHLFDNYASLGLGNFGTINADLFINRDLGNNNKIGGSIRHRSSQGSIKGIELKNNYYDTAANINYGASSKNLTWKSDLDYQNQVYNWYGLPSGFGNGLTPENRKILIDNINPQHIYNTISLGGEMELNEGFFKKMILKGTHFTDNYGSAENHIVLKPSFQFAAGEQMIKTLVIADYLGGSFDKNLQNTNTEKIKYGFINIGISPSFVLERNDWTLNLGVTLFYNIDNIQAKNKLYLYPQINASYKVVADLMIFYAGAEGNLEQNSYQNFSTTNTFLAPSLTILPTDKQYDVFAGLKGKLVNNLSYNLRAAYVNEKNKALFHSTDYNENSSNANYAFGNAFQVVYDNIKTIRFSADLKAALSDNFSFGLSGVFDTYTPDFQTDAWNLPKLKLSTDVDFNITPKWFAGVTAFYVGNRNDIQVNTNNINIVAPSPITLPSYFDANAHLGYQYNERLSGFLKANNITNQSYQKWLNYPVQGFQIVLGANYKFDF